MPITIDGIQLYTIKEIAQTLHITVQTARLYVRQGKLKGQRVGRPILITGDSLRAFLGGDNGKAPDKPEGR